MKKRTSIVAVALLAATIGGVGRVSAGRKAEPVVPLSDAGNSLFAKYSGLLAGLQAEIGRVAPKIDEQDKAALQKARDAVKAAEADANTSRLKTKAVVSRSRISR